MGKYKPAMVAIIVVALVAGGFVVRSEPQARAADGTVDRATQASDDPVEGCAGVESLEDANSAFALRLLRSAERDRKDGKNLLLSPLSAQLALQMLANGADDDTWEDLLRSMCLHGRSVRDVNVANRELREALAKSGAGVDFTDANSIWTNVRYTPRTQLADAVRTHYDGEFDTFDVADATGSAKRINGWIDKSTKHRIKQAVTPEDIDPPDTEMVMFLVNALTFDGTWTTKFDESNTHDADFTLEDDTKTKVRMMTETAEFPVGWHDPKGKREPAFVGARLPYGKSERFAMHVLVPSGDHDLDDILKWLDADSWSSWREGYNAGSATVSIPKMQVGTTQELLGPLGELGLPKATYNSVLTQDPPGDVEIMFVRQKTMMEVDEQGTEAAAVTIIGAGIAAGFDSGPAVVADRPYVVVLDDSKTGAILFAGVIANPNDKPA